MGWIYNSNKLEGNSDSVDTWLISPYSGHIETVFFIMNNGMIKDSSYGGYNGSLTELAVRPTLYLSPSVNIIDGDGSINNPYKLSNS